MFGLKKEFWLGVWKALAYYVTGFASVWGTYLVFGWEYRHAPGLHHLVGLLVLVIGAILLIRRLIEMFTHPSNSRNKGSLLTHAVAVASFIVLFKLIILNGAIKRDTGIEKDLEISSVDKKSRVEMIKKETATSKFVQVNR